ncbi:MAG: peptidoglycan editing factor PgeF [bacterium]
MPELEIREADGVEFLISPLLEECGFVRHAFSTRRGGVSEGSFRSLNLGPADGEDPDRIQENRKRFFKAAGFPPAKVAEVNQVHGVEVVDAADVPDEGRVSADGIMTNAPEVLLTIQTADCVPVLLADSSHRVVAAVHAGRAGTAAGVVDAAVERMTERYESDPRDLIAALGPGISITCYEVAEECVVPFRSRYPDWREFCSPLSRGQWLLDLPDAVRRQLLMAGIPEKQIGTASFCTFSESARFFSYRRDGSPTGRLLSAIGIF